VSGDSDGVCLRTIPSARSADTFRPREAITLGIRAVFRSGMVWNVSIESLISGTRRLPVASDEAREGSKRSYYSRPRDCCA